MTDTHKNEDLKELWLKFNEYSNKLSSALGRTSNIVGEYAEHLACSHYGGTLLRASGASADFETKDKTGKKIRYQVKSRKIKQSPTTQLSVIRSWDFDFLVVILFDTKGEIKKAMKIPVDTAKTLAVNNEYQKGWVITTNDDLLTHECSEDITTSIALQMVK